jgi:hypothetical protein
MTDNSPEKRRARWQEYIRMQIAACDQKIAVGLNIEAEYATRQEFAANLESMPEHA